MTRNVDYRNLKTLGDIFFRPYIPLLHYQKFYQDVYMSFRGSSKAPSHCCFLIARPLLLGLFVFECEARTTVAGYFFWKRLRICIGMTPLLYVAEELGGLYWCLSWMTPKVFRADGGLLPPVLQKRLL